MHKLTVAAAALLALGGPASAQDVLFTCGPLKGYSYFLNEGRGADMAGWQEDGSVNGQVLLVQGDDGLDVLLNDAKGPRSVKDEGGIIVDMQAAPGRYVVDVVYGESLSRFMFSGGVGGREVLLAHFVHSHAELNSAGLYRGPCE